MLEHISAPLEFVAYLKRFRESQTITISDTGKGMSEDDLQNRFLVIGTPGKYIEKKGPKKDEPPILGDKGIGRLSMMPAWE